MNFQKEQIDTMQKKDDPRNRKHGYHDRGNMDHHYQMKHMGYQHQITNYNAYQHHEEIKHDITSTEK